MQSELSGEVAAAPSRAERRAADKEEIKAILEEEKLAGLDEVTAEGFRNVDALTGRPGPDDTILFAIPMCGPYSAMNGWKYRAKLMPGTQKKGKSARSAMELFSRVPDATPVEKEVMKAIKDSELFATMMSNAAVVAPGMSALNSRKGKGGRGGKGGGSGKKSAAKRAAEAEAEAEKPGARGPSKKGGKGKRGGK